MIKDRLKNKYNESNDDSDDINYYFESILIQSLNTQVVFCIVVLLL
jgi:hypothetical protein